MSIEEVLALLDDHIKSYDSGAGMSMAESVHGAVALKEFKQAIIQRVNEGAH